MSIYMYAWLALYGLGSKASIIQQSSPFLLLRALTNCSCEAGRRHSRIWFEYENLCTRLISKTKQKKGQTSKNMNLIHVDIQLTFLNILLREDGDRVTDIPLKSTNTLHICFSHSEHTKNNILIVLHYNEKGEPSEYQAKWTNKGNFDNSIHQRQSESWINID